MTTREESGLAAGDTLVAVDGIRVTRDSLDTLVSGVEQGAEAEIHAFRRDELMRFRARPRPAPADTCELRVLPDAPQDTVRRRAAWLGSRS